MQWDVDFHDVCLILTFTLLTQPILYLEFFLFTWQKKRSMITGRSMHNQRIERLWRDLWCCSVLSNYYAAFHHLEDSGFLDTNNDLCILCLQFVMISRINVHLNIFQSTWEWHPLPRQGHKSPKHLWISRQISSTETLCDQVEQDLIGATPAILTPMSSLTYRLCQDNLTHWPEGDHHIWRLY